MAVQRYISSSFWSDDWVDSLTIQEKLLYMYLLTNECTNPAGVYKITIKRMKDDTGISRDDINTILENFKNSGKAFYIDEFIILPKWPKHQKFGERGKLYLGAMAVIKALPDNIKEFVSDRKHYDFDLGKIGYAKKPIPYTGNEQNDDTLSQETAKSTENEQEPDTISNDSEFEFDSEFDIDIKNSGGLNSFLGAEKPPGIESPVENSPPPTELLQIIKDKAKIFEFYLDDPVVCKIANLMPYPVWFTDKHSIIDFAAQKIKENYSDKPKAEQKKLFISALTAWENIRDEYPDWLNKQYKDDKRNEIEKRKESRPTVCQCGESIAGKKRCPKCGGFFNWEDKSGDWVFEQGVIDAEFTTLRKNQNNKPPGGTAEPIETQPEEPDF